MIYRFRKIVIPLLLSIVWSFESFSQITLVKDGKPLSRIVLLENDSIDKSAAVLLQDFVHRISGATLPIVNGQQQSGDVIIGGKSTEAGEDGFTIKTVDNQLRISNGGDRGTIYGVVTLLERYMGVSYYAYEAYNLTKSKTISLPKIDLTETPAFRKRAVGGFNLKDPIYKMWFRIEYPKEDFVGGSCHTVGRLVPPALYGKTHPEYYALIQGERHPESMIQLCMTNPDLEKVIGDRIDSMFRAHPEKKMVSVSQGDGATCYCHCEECEKVYKEEGAISGAYIRFLNKLAKRFPDKIISTLAYQFTMHPPKKVKPLPNVNIVLCNIGCDREVPLTDNASGRDFMKALEGWGKISNDITMWDYGINFDNMVSCFPNLHILQKNLQLFKENHVTISMCQLNDGRGTDYSELRDYMLAKLMWNPYQNADSLMRSFIDGFYGPASPYIYKYHKIIEGALLASGIPLKLYDSPVSHKFGMLNENLCKVYDELYDKAESVVSNDSTYLSRVRIARLSLIFSELEILRTQPNYDVDKAKKLLDRFDLDCEKYGVAIINEGGTTPAIFCNNYRKRFLVPHRDNKAYGAKVIFETKPTGVYQKIADTALTDGLFGGGHFAESWVGWEGSDASFILDMGMEKEISSIESDFLLFNPRWVFFPHKITYEVSNDGSEYRDFGSYKFSQDYKGREPRYTQAKVESSKPVKVRYIKVKVDGWETCPEWHDGVGYPGWFFIDEVTVL